MDHDRTALVTLEEYRQNLPVIRKELANAKDNAHRLSLLADASASAAKLQRMEQAGEFDTEEELDDARDIRRAMYRLEAKAEIAIAQSPYGTSDPWEGAERGRRQKVSRYRKAYRELSSLLETNLDGVADRVRVGVDEHFLPPAKVRQRMKRAHDSTWGGCVSKPRTKELLIDRWGARCFGCGWPARWPNGDMRESMLEIEHLVPRSNARGAELANCVLICKECSLAKGTKLTMEELRLKNAREDHLYCALSELPDLDEHRAWAVEAEAAEVADAG